MNITRTLVPLFIAATTLGAHAQHLHTYAGDGNHDGYLDFVGPLHGGTLRHDSGVTHYSDEGFAYHGILTPTALNGSNLSAAADPSGTLSDPNGALSGTIIRLVLYGVAGPTGATFGFYEAGAEDITLSLVTGDTGGTGSFALTDPLYSADGNPFGHIHGRQFVANQEGTYTVTWALANELTDGSGTRNSLDLANPGQRLFTQTFTAIPEPGTLALLGLASIAGLLAWHRRR